MKRNPNPLWLLVLAILLFAVLVVTINFQQLTDGLGYGLVLIMVGLAIALAVLLIYCLCRWHGRRRMLLIFGGFSLIVILLYAEEDVRGWLAWQKVKRQAESAGEKLDFASVVPPLVPADQNFALTPIVISSYAAYLDTNGHKISPPLTNVVNRLDMHICRDPEWASSPTNGDWRRGTFTDLKAWQLYYSTPPTNSLTNEFPAPHQPQSAAADVLFGLGKFDSTIEELRKAGELPQSRFPVNYDSSIPFFALFPHLSPLKRCTQVLQLRALAELGTGQTDRALIDILLALRLINSTRSEPMIISHLVRMSELTLTLQPVYEGLARHEWSAAQLPELQNVLGKMNFLEDCQLAVRGERNAALTTVDYLQQYRNQDALLMLVTPDMFIGDKDDEKDDIRWDLILAGTFYRLAPAGWFWMNEALIGKMYQECVPGMEFADLRPENASGFTFAGKTSRRGT